MPTFPPTMRALPISLLIGWLGLALPAHSTPASEPKEAPGIKRIQLVTDIREITPGEAFTLALEIEPLPGYHTYWKGPGIVGVATSFEWNLPDGFTAGEVMWPAPAKVDMAGIIAYGYDSPVMLLTQIQTPGRIAGTSVTLRLKSAWMACAASCNPGVAEFALTIPVAREGSASKDATTTERMERFRNAVPRPAPESWKVSPELPKPDRILLNISIPGLEGDSTDGIYFFCHDMQVDSDAVQKVSIEDSGSGGLHLTLVRPDFAPRSPAGISGVLYRPGGWPGIAFPYVEISAPWPRDTFKHEQP